MDNLFLTTFWGKPKWDIFTLKTVSDKLLDRKYRQEDYLKDVLNHGLSEKAGENGDVVDTGGSIKTKYLKDMRGFNEDICGNTPGDVELMCRLNFSGIVFGYAKNVFSIHYHLGSSDVKRGIIESHDVKWEPQVAIRNRDGYGELTEAEENSRIKYAKNS